MIPLYYIFHYHNLNNNLIITFTYFHSHALIIMTVEHHPLLISVLLSIFLLYRMSLNHKGLNCIC